MKNLYLVLVLCLATIALAKDNESYDPTSELPEVFGDNPEFNSTLLQERATGTPTCQDAVYYCDVDTSVSLMCGSCTSPSGASYCKVGGLSCAAHCSAQGFLYADVGVCKLGHYWYCNTSCVIRGYARCVCYNNA